MKNKILKIINFVMGVTWTFSVSCIDSEYNTPFITAMLISSVWFILFAKANGYFYDD